MNRRRFLRSTSLAIPGLALSSWWLEACKKNQLEEAFTFKGRVAVIGAGSSGLYAAHLLKSYGANVTVFEATNRWGGRVRSMNAWNDAPLEMGAEFIRGQRSIWYQTLANSAAPRAVEGANYFVVENVVTAESALAAAADKATFNDLLTGLKDYAGEENSLFLYGALNGLSERLRPAFYAMVANDRGTDQEQLGVLGVARTLQQWSAGEGNYRANGSALQEALASWADELGGALRLNTPIVRIDYSGATILLTDSMGTVHEADRVLVTIPISILQSNGVFWWPTLPLVHRQSFAKIGMSRAIKIQLKFTEAFWPGDMRRLLGGALVPEYWSPSTLDGSSIPVLTAMAYGAAAEALHALGTDMTTAILQELNALFGGSVAADRFVESIMVDWGEEVYTKGGFSFTKQNEGDARSLMKQPVSGKIFFAGEAMHDQGHHGTVHGALETGYRAAIELLQS